MSASAPKPDSAQSYGDIHWALLVGVHHQRDSYDARFERIEKHGESPLTKLTRKTATSKSPCSTPDARRIRD